MVEKLAVIISFEYNGEGTYLPGCLADIYRIYNMIENANYDRIVIITDSDPSDIELSHITSKARIEPTLFFIRDIMTSYTSKEQVMKLITQVLTCPKGLLYFSGHSMNKKLILPDGYISDYELMTIISSVTDSSHETILIFDCCHGTNFLLPYRYDGSVYHLVDDVKLYVPHSIISICSSNSTEQSFSDIIGSDLTRSLSTHIQQLSIKKIYSGITFDVMSSSKSKPNIYCTYPNMHYIYPWVIHPIKYRIVIDRYNNEISVM